MPLVNLQDKFVVRGGTGGEISAPSNVTISNKSASGFTVTWDSVASALGYKLDVATDSGFTSFVSGYNGKDVAGTSQAVTGLSPNTTYYTRVRAVVASSNSGAVSESTDSVVVSASTFSSLGNGLQAFYKLDDESDVSGNGNTLTNTGGVTFSSGKIGDAADFDGNNSKYLSSASNLGQITGSGFSFSVWFKKTNGNNNVVAASGPGGDTHGWFLATNNDNNIYFLAGTGSGWATFDTAGTYSVDTWTHVVITSTSGGSVSYYVNGSLTTTNNSVAWTAAPLYIGKNIADGTSFGGQIDAVGIWNRALTSGEIAELYNQGNGKEVSSLLGGLQAFYKLSDLTDSSGNNRTLTNNGNVSFAAGKIGNAAVFNGSNRLYTDSFSTINTSQPFSVSFWSNPTANTLASICANGNGVGFNIHNDSSGSLNFNNGQSGDCSVAGAFVEGVWKHYVCMVSNGNTVVYINGSEVYNQQSNVSYSATINSLSIGAYTENQLLFNGSIDAVGVWNRALTSGEIAELYNSGSGLE